MSLLKRPIKAVKLHAGIFVLGLGNIGDTLPSSSKTYELRMHHEEQGVFVWAKIPAGPSQEFLVPWAAVNVAVYGPELPKEEQKQAETPKASAKK